MNEMMKINKQTVIKKNKKRGFTLVELIVVIAIIAILAALLIPLVSKYIGQATGARGQANARAIYTAAAAYGAEAIASGGAISTGELTSELTPYLGNNIGGIAAAQLNEDGSVKWAAWIADGTNKWYDYPKGASHKAT